MSQPGEVGGEHNVSKTRGKKAQNTKSHLQPGEDGGTGTGGADNRSEVGESRTTRCCL